VVGHPAPAAPPPRRCGGRPRVDDRAALAGIVYQLQTGVPWRLLPARQLGCGSPITCWRRLRDWQRAGVWQRLHRVLLDQLGRNGQLDWSRASLDSLSVRASGGELTGANPTDRGKPGSKYRCCADQQFSSSIAIGRGPKPRCEAPDRNPVLHTALSGRPARSGSLTPPALLQIDRVDRASTRCL